MAIRITHDVVEVKRRGDANVRITHAVTEAMREGDPNVRITHAIIEVLRLSEASGWTGKICGVTNPSKICGIAVADIAKVCGI